MLILNHRHLVVPAVLCLVAGCATSSAAAPPESYPAAPTLVPAAAVGRPGSDLHVYVVDGADPAGWAGTARLADRLRWGGYPHTRYAGMTGVGQVEREIRGIHARNPAARFALIGYSAGTIPVRNAANRLVRDGVPVAMVGYVGGDYLTDTAESRVVGAGRVVNIRGNGYLLTGRNLVFNGADLTGARNLRLSGTHHFGLMKHPTTLATLSEELALADAGQ
jgi:hypothetical protein